MNLRTMTKEVKNKGARGGRFQKGRMPHNAKVATYDDIADLVRAIGAEPKRATVRGEEVSMSWSERSLRLSIERAINGQTRDLIDLLKLMIKHPRITGPARMRQITVVRGALANC